MICKVISRRIQKLDLGDSYRRQFQSVLESIQERYRCDALSKAFLIKRVCTKYLKICNSLLPSQPVQSSLSALQFIKSLQLDIYQGKSYQLYIIKITMHILYVRCYDLKLSQLKKRLPTTLIKRRSFQQQQRQWCRRRYRYIERLKMFCAQIQQCYFSVYLLKDYYSNLQQLYFLCLRQEMQKLVDDFFFVGTGCQAEDNFSLIQVGCYIDKLYQLLKGHMLELNEMLVYEEKKVYEILAVKIGFMIDAFILQAVVKFVEYADEERMSRSQAQESSQIKGIKEKFIDQEIQYLWHKYHPLFSKMPNHVDQQLIYNKFEQIVESLTQRPQDNYTFTDKVDTNKFQSMSNFSKSLSKNNSGSKSKMQSEAKLNDFMSFGQQTISINQINSSTTLHQQKKEPFSNLKSQGQNKSNVNLHKKHKKQQQFSLPTTQQKGVTQNLSLGLASDGFRRLTSLKTPSLNMLQKIKDTQFQRLRRINSTDLIRTLKSPLFQPLKKTSQKKKDRRSKTQYFPFIGESKGPLKKDLLYQLSDFSKRNNSSVNKILFPFKQPDSAAKSPTNNINTNQSRLKQPLKLITRSNNKKTTLDMMSFEQRRNSFRESKEINLSEVEKIFSFAEVLAKQDLGVSMQMFQV